jgi:hypothetical protein
MTDKNQTEATVPDGSDEAQQDVAKATDTKAEATGTAKASDELSEDDLKAVSGGRYRGNLGNFARPGYRK